MIGSRKSMDCPSAVRHDSASQVAYEKRGRTKVAALRPLMVFIVSVAMSGNSFGQETSGQQNAAMNLAAHVQSIVSSRCMDCHNESSAEAEVRFDNFTTLKLDAKLELLNRAQDQIFFGLMPPMDADQPTTEERETLAGWLRSELRTHNASKLDEKLREPAYGNYVDHEKLFDGSITDKAFTPARRWLVSPQIFHERVNAVFKLIGNTLDNAASTV